MLIFGQEELLKHELADIENDYEGRALSEDYEVKLSFNISNLSPNL